MTTADSIPRGLRNWSKDDWKKFVEKNSPVDGQFQSRNFRGAFGGVEIVTLVAVAKGLLPVEYVVGIYGHGALDMFEQWGADIDAGIVDPELDDLGVNTIEFVERNFAAIKGMLL